VSTIEYMIWIGRDIEFYNEYGRDAEAEDFDLEAKV